MTFGLDHWGPAKESSGAADGSPGVVPAKRVDVGPNQGHGNDCRRDVPERYGMVILITGASIAATCWLGWMGYKASLRIQAWGRGLDACDEIFRIAGEQAR